jgi:hypothetical protein
MATLEEVIAEIFADGTVTAAEGQRALNLGTPEQIAQISGASIGEVNQFIADNNLSQASTASPSPTSSPLEDLVSQIFSDGTVTADEGKSALELGTPEQIAQISGTPLSVVNQFIADHNLSPAPGTTLPSIQDGNQGFESLFGGNLAGIDNLFTDLNPSTANPSPIAIPEFLKPFLAESADTSHGALQGLTSVLSKENALTSPFNSLQELSQQMALNEANGEFVNHAKNVFRQTASGETAVDVFNQSRSLLANPDGLDALQSLNTPSNTAAISALEDTASGDFLYGNPGFDAAVQASVAQAMPNINSQFSLQGGAGALSGGLKDSAIAEVTANAFAREFGNERNRQVGAANQLNNFGLNATGQRLGALNSLIGAQQKAGSVLTGVADQERARQLQAAAQLPGIGLLDSSIIGGVGDLRQQQEERAKQGQVQSLQQLLGSSFGNINPTALFGNSQPTSLESRNRVAGGLGGALAGGEIGGLFDSGLFGLSGGATGAIAGGLLGAFG